MGASEEIITLQWKVPTALTFEQVVAEADRVLGAKDVPASRLKAGMSTGTFRTGRQEGVSVDYKIAKAVPAGYGVIRVGYSGGPSPSVRFQILDADIKRQKITILLIPIPISPWYAPAMAEFRDASARLRASVALSRV